MLSSPPLYNSQSDQVSESHSFWFSLSDSLCPATHDNNFPSSTLLLCESMSWEKDLWHPIYPNTLFARQYSSVWQQKFILSCLSGGPEHEAKERQLLQDAKSMNSRLSMSFSLSLSSSQCLCFAPSFSCFPSFGFMMQHKLL